MATGHFDYTTGTLEKEKLRNRDIFFSGKLQKNENRHKMCRRWWFLRSDRWFFDVLTTPDAFQTSELQNHPTFDEKRRGILLIFSSKNWKMKMFTKSVVIENQHKLVQTASKFREKANREVKKFTGRVSEQFKIRDFKLFFHKSAASAVRPLQ